MGNAQVENPSVLPGGLISKIGLTETKAKLFKAKQRDKDFMDWLLNESIRRALQHIEVIITDLQERMWELLKRMTQAEEELADLDKKYNILEAELKDFQEKSHFDWTRIGV